MPEVIQLLAGGISGSAVVNEALALERAMRGWGYAASTYAIEVHPSLRGSVRPLSQCRAGERDVLLLHITTDSPTMEFALHSGAKLVLVYHNFTPPLYMRGLGHIPAEHMRSGRAKMASLCERTTLALAHSAYSEHELREAGFACTAVLPVLVPTTLLEIAPDTRGIDGYRPRGEGLNLLHVGRVAPNKCIEDVVRVFYYYRQIVPRAQLHLVGDFSGAESYHLWLRQFVRTLKLDGVHFAGQVSDARLAAYYRIADTYLCMSEHEGFCVPLVESMRFQAPVIAYDSTAVSETLGDSGVLVHRKDHALLAGMVHLLNIDNALRTALLARQNTQAERYTPETVLRQWRAHLAPLVEGHPKP